MSLNVKIKVRQISGNESPVWCSALIWWSHPPAAFSQHRCVSVSQPKVRNSAFLASQRYFIKRKQQPQKINQTKNNIDWKSSRSWLDLPQVSFNVDLPPGRILLISFVLLSCFSKLRFCHFARSECPEDTFTHLYLSAFHQLTDLLMSN